jgi:hypothetical protein
MMRGIARRRERSDRGHITGRKEGSTGANEDTGIDRHLTRPIHLLLRFLRIRREGIVIAAEGRTEEEEETKVIATMKTGGGEAIIIIIATRRTIIPGGDVLTDVIAEAEVGAVVVRGMIVVAVGLDRTVVAGAERARV